MDAAPHSVLMPAVTTRSFAKGCTPDWSKASSARGSRDPGAEAKAGAFYEFWSFGYPF